MIERRFGESCPWSVGVEEEVMLLDAGTLELSPGIEALLRGVERRELPGVVKTELFASIAELATGVCATAPEAVEALLALRSGAGEAAGRAGLALAAAGSHPISRAEQQEVVQDPRYLRFVEYAGVSARIQAVCGLHVHVGMPDAESCLLALEGVLPWLPLVLALSANSPYLAGLETGLASARAAVLAQLPRSGAPPPFASYAEWERWVERLVALGLAEDYTRIWWDVRPHPRFGTLELRMPDQPTALARTGAFVALLQALCAAVLEQAPAGPADRGLYAQNRWAASRFGSAAELVHPDGTRTARARDLAAELLELVEPFAHELGAAELLAALDPAASEAERQLEIGRKRGLEAVCADLVERTR